MKPRTQLSNPRATDGSLQSDTRDACAERAATSLMNSPIVDWQGKAATVRELTHAIGMDEAIKDAAIQVFLALTDEGISYREYRLREDTAHGARLNDDATRRAVHYFYRTIEDSYDLQSMGLGRGELLLVPFDYHVTRYLRQCGMDAQERKAS